MVNLIATKPSVFIFVLVQTLSLEIKKEQKTTFIERFCMTEGLKKEGCCKSSDPSYQAYQLLHIAFTVAPIVAGVDKFFNFLTQWHQYLSTRFDLLGNAHTTMMAVGIIEIIAGIGIWFKPKIFSYIVALWLLAIIVNLVMLGKFYDIALRDVGLLLGVLALGRLSHGCCEK